MNVKQIKIPENKKSAKWWSYIIRTLFILLIGVGVGFLALCMVYMLPVERMYENAQVSKDIISDIGTTYAIHEIRSTELDTYTDSIMVSTAICPKEASVFEKVVYNYHVGYYRGYLEQENLERYLSGEPGYDYASYSHYWNGYLLFLKPLLYFFEYNDILMFNFILQTMLIVWVVIGMVKKKKEYLIIPFMISILSMAAPLATAINLQNSDILYLALLGSGIIIWGNDKIIENKGYFIFLVLGMMTSYFDFLTYPLVSLGIPLVVYIACVNTNKVFETVVKTIVNSIGWGIGYVGMWIGKGLLGSILYPDSRALETGIEHFFMRSSNSVSSGQVSFVDVTINNLYIYLSWPMIVIFLIVVIYAFIKIIKRRNWKRDTIVRMVPYIVVLIYPFAWYFILKNHSYIHPFVYRNLAIATFAGLTALFSLAEQYE